MKVIIDMCFILLIKYFINVSLFLIVISCEGLILHPTSKVVYKDN
jgi:hypothetical protein